MLWLPFKSIQRMNGAADPQVLLLELEKGMKGQLNILTPGMEDLITAISINQWQGVIHSLLVIGRKWPWPSMKNLMAQFADMICATRNWPLVLRLGHTLLVVVTWTFQSHVLHHTVMQVTARSTGTLDQMTTDTHVTTLSLSPNSWITILKTVPSCTASSLRGPAWPVGEEAGDTEMVTGVPTAGYLVDSRLKELLPPLPVTASRQYLYNPHGSPPPWDTATLTLTFTRPMYLTSFRGATYVFLATMKTVDPNSKWVLTGTALLMQTD